MERKGKTNATQAKGKTNVTKKSREDGQARENARRALIWDSKMKKIEEEKEKEDEKRREEEEKRREEEEKRRKKMREEEEKMREEEEKRREVEKKRRLEKEKRRLEKEKRRLEEKEQKKNQFGNVTYLVIEFPKGGEIETHRSFLGSSSLIPPCMVKAIYLNRDAQNIHDKHINGHKEMRNIFFGDNPIVPGFAPLRDYDEELLDFLLTYMVNMCEWVTYVRANDERRYEWCIAYYWRLEWLKHGYSHGISEFDYYWKIFDLYQKISVDRVLKTAWAKKSYYVGGFSEDPTEKADVMTVMACRVSQIAKEISYYTGHLPAIFVESASRGLRQIHIPFDVDENFIPLPTQLGIRCIYDSIIYV